MIATVVSIAFNVAKQGARGPYTVTEFTVQADPYKGKAKDPKTYPVFTNVPYHNLLTQLKPGERVELEFTQNGQFKNLSNVTRSANAPAPSTSAPTASGGGTKSYGGGENKDAAIARAVALKAGVETFTALVAGGYMKKTLKPEAAVEEIFAITRRFEKYCTLEDDLSELSANGESIVPSSGQGGYEDSELPD